MPYTRIDYSSPQSPWDHLTGEPLVPILRYTTSGVVIQQTPLKEQSA